MFWTSIFVFASNTFVLSASFLTSSATTAKPLPALAASIAALSADKFVWSAIFPNNTYYIFNVFSCQMTSLVLPLTFCIDEVISSTEAAVCE